MEFIRPGKPTENGHIESFNGRFQEECLDTQAFSSLAEARRIIEAWRQDYNVVRPHSSLAGMSPEAMTIGLNIFRDPKFRSLPRLLAMPFL